MTARDLADFRVVWEEPLQTGYRDLRVFAPGLSATGGVDTIEALNLLELAGTARHGVPFKSAESLFWLMQITDNQNQFFDPELAARGFPDRSFSAGSRDQSARAVALEADARWARGPMRPSP